MDKKDKALIAAAVVICVIICVLSPYIASGDPDGLEKSAEDSGLAEDFSVEDIKGIPEAVMPDYAFANDPDNHMGLHTSLKKIEVKFFNFYNFFFF